MLRKIIAIGIIISLMLLIAGCGDEKTGDEPEDIESEEDAQEAIVDISDDISDISDTLESINEDLG